MLGTLLLCLAATPATGFSAPFERYTLDNGLTVILHEDHRLPQVTVNLWFRVGSGDEAKGRSGFAHLFEHLMFMGTKDVPNGEFDRVMEEAGGSNNATTSSNRTNYFESGPSNLLETFLWLEADRLAHLADDMTKAKVDLQRDVVKNERRQRYENRPYGMASLLLQEKLYPENHPYHHTTIGSHADLTAASVDDVKNFFKKHYVPANASLVIAGDFDAKQARAWVQQYFGALTRVEPPVRAVPSMVSLEKSMRLTKKEAASAARVVRCWLAPAAWSRGATEAELLAMMLGDGKTGVFDRALVEEQKLATDVSVSYDAARGVSDFCATATAQSGHTAEELEKALDAELTRVLTSGLDATEFTNTRARLQVRNLMQLDEVSTRADQLNELQTELGDPGLLGWAAQGRFDVVTVSDVNALARELLKRPSVTLAFIPEKKKGVGP